MSSSTNSATLAPHKYEVFLSFRGEDTRYGFVSHLFKALSDKGIRTFIDEKSLERGNEIEYSLQHAIQESKACVVVFSENYGSSRWCLDELVHILKCKERHGQIVVPIFYHVEPTHVRNRNGRFGEAFSTLEDRFPGSSVGWRTALSTASGLAGWYLSGTSPEADDVEKIVEDVKRKLNFMPQPNEEFKGLVGIKKRIDEIESLLCLSTCDAVCAIGIWGMGGIGKTTLADAAFKKFSSCFKGCCFLRNVREEWANTRERKSLKKKLHSEILRDEDPYNAEDRLREKKVLIVLDDIDDEDQLKLLVGDCNGFGSGSRVIVTTRNEQMVRYFEADDDVEVKLYPVQGLNDAEALQLFNLKAFKGQSSKANQYYINEISKEVVNYAKGIPLALEVLGSLLRCKKKEEWKSYLNQLEEEPNDKIQKVLKVSYDGLNKKDQSIFLDIACFFKGKERGSVEETLNACYVSANFCAKTRISNLIERALITVSREGSEILQMHDLVQEMGHEIASSNNIEPGKRSRLWNAEDIFDVLKNNSGTKAIEGIKLNWTSNIEVVEFGPSAFEGMNNLRFLEIDRFMGYKAVFPGGIQYLPNTLRYLHWDQCGLKFFPSNFTAQNLVRLDMIDSGIEQLWNGVQNLVNLRHIILNCCHNLTRIPDLSRAPKLESIYISSCLKLVEVPPLNFQVSGNHISSQKIFRKYIGFVHLRDCRSLKYLPNISGNVKRLDLTASVIHEIPSSIKDLSKLIELRVGLCISLKALPQLPLSLQLLDATGCESLETVATSQSAVVQAHREDYHVTHYEEFQFVNCPRLDRKSRQSLMTESHIRVLRTAILFMSKAEEISNNNSTFHTRKETSYKRSTAYKILRRDELFKDDKPGFQMCIPGNEIPKWFRYQSKKSRITIKLRPNWQANFIGFALCAVVDYRSHEIDYLRESNTVRFTYSFQTSDDEDYTNYDDLFQQDWSVRCTYSFKTSDDEDHRTYNDLWQQDSSPDLSRYLSLDLSPDLSLYLSPDSSPDLSPDLSRYSSRDSSPPPGYEDSSEDHLFIWYLHKDYRGDCHGATGISFEFDTKRCEGSSKQKIKMCGVHMLYRQEVEELGINENGMTLEQNNDNKKKRQWS